MQCCPLELVNLSIQGARLRTCGEGEQCFTPVCSSFTLVSCCEALCPVPLWACGGPELPVAHRRNGTFLSILWLMGRGLWLMGGFCGSWDRVCGSWDGQEPCSPASCLCCAQQLLGEEPPLWPASSQLQSLFPELLFPSCFPV